MSTLKTTANGGRSRITPVVLLFVPLFLAASLYLSAVFKVISALPIIYAFLKKGRVYGFVSAFTNAALIWVSLGRTDAAWFFVLSIVLGVTLSESLRMKLKVEWTVLLTMTMMLLASFLLLTSYAKKLNMSPVGVVESAVQQEVDTFIKNSQKYRDSAAISNDELDHIVADPADAKHRVLSAIPSVVLIGLLIIVVANLLLVLRFNFGGVREKNEISPDFFKNWKAPDHMVWPTLAVGFCLVLEIPLVSEVAAGLFRVLMAIYCIQGLAIMRFLFDRWGMKAMFRPFAYAIALTFLLPLVVSLGFFDLWFSFRERFGNA